MAGHVMGGPGVPCPADREEGVEATGPGGLDECADEEGGIEELNVDAPLIAELEPRFGAVEGIVALRLLPLRLAIVGHLEMLDEAGRNHVKLTGGLLLFGQLGEGRVGDPEYAPGDIHEAGGRPEHPRQVGIRSLNPIERLVQMGIHVDDAHVCPPLLLFREHHKPLPTPAAALRALRARRRKLGPAST